MSTYGEEVVAAAVRLTTRCIVSCVVIVVGLLAASPAAAQTRNSGRRYPIDLERAPRPVAEATRITGRIAVDGRLDDAPWQHAIPITDFIQSQPRAGFPPTERTVARVMYDDRNLYVGAMCYDSEPDKLVITSLEQDFGGAGGSTRDMDIFAITLDTFLDRRNSFIFLVNPGGAYRDGQTFNDSRQIDFAWRAIVQVKTAVNDSGYTVEMAIPWTTLRFNPSLPNHRWGLNLLRRVRRKGEDSYWAPVDRRDPVHRMSKAGTLQGLRGLRSGRNIQIKPFTLVSDISGANPVAAGEDGFEPDIGGDIKWGVTSGLTLDGTVRTDFSQVEVDQEQVNLTRFPLFFPERRDFFVENSGSFLLGDITERNYRTGSSLRDFTLFHSRRIGLDAGRPIPIMAGGRLTGRAGDFELGLLNIQTEALGDLPSENFGVVRVRRNLGGSDVGMMFINREATGSLSNGEYNRSFGADANLRFLNNLLVNTYVAYTDEPGATGNQTAARVAVGWRDRIWNMTAFAKQIGDGFDPGVGFVRRRGIRHGYATFGAHPRPDVPFVQEINPYGEVHYVTDLDNELLTRRDILAFGVTFLDGATLDIRYQNRFERLVEPDEINEVEIPAGRYTTNDASVTFRSSRAKPFSASVTVAGGGFFDGTSRSVTARALWRAHYRLSIDGSITRNEVDLAAGSFDADVYRSRVRIAYSTELFASAFVQYNRQTTQLVTNLRVNWVYSPLSDVFLVFTERRDVSNGGVGVIDRAITVKATKLFAF